MNFLLKFKLKWFVENLKANRHLSEKLKKQKYQRY